MSSPLRVVHIIGGGEFGGAEDHIIHLLKQLELENVQAEVICFYESVFAKILREKGIKVDVLSYGRFDFGLFFGLVKLLREKKPHIVHTHGVKANFFGRLAAKKLKISPVVTTVHSILKYDYTNPVAYQLAYMLEASTRKYNHRYIAISNTIKEQLIQEGVPESKIQIIHHGVDTNKFIPQDDEAAKRLASQWGKNEGTFLIGAVGRLQEVKGFNFFIQACAALNNKYPNQFRFVLIGDGPYRKDLEQLTRQLGLMDVFTFAGFRDDVDCCLRALDCYVSSSLSEGLGLAVMEALATGVPVVTTGVGGINDFAHNEENSLVIEPRNVDQLVNSMERIYTDSQLANRLTNQAMQDIKMSFSLDQMGQATAMHYEKWVQGTSNSSNILILGYYGFDNAGDDSVLYGIISSLRKKDSSLAFSVLSNSPNKTEQSFGVKAFNRWNLAEVVRQLKAHDLLLVGGGSLLQDATSPRSILYYLGTVLVAKLLGKPVVFYAQGIGPITKPVSKRLIRRIVNKVDVITVRDYKSAEELREFGVDHTSIEVTADPAVTIPAESIDLEIGKRLLNEINLSTSNTIAISVRDWKKEHQYKKVLAETADYYAAKGWNILFIPMQFPADVSACQDIMKRMNEKAFILEKPLNFKEIMSVIGNVQIVLGMRLHSIILAGVMNVPFIGISYDPKIERFVERVNMCSAGHINTLQVQDVIDKIDYTILNENQIKKELAENMNGIIAEAEKSSQLTINQLQ